MKERTWVIWYAFSRAFIPIALLNFAILSKQKELYFTFTVLNHALRKKEIELVSNQPVPEWAKAFPTMRKAGGRARDGRVLNWHIGHGLRLYTVEEMKQALFVQELTPEQSKLSIASIWPISTLAIEIERGWLPERNEEFEEADRKKRTSVKLKSPQSSSRKRGSLTTIFIFPNATMLTGRQTDCEQKDGKLR